MVLFFSVIIYSCLLTGVCYGYELSWLPCKFIDETIYMKNADGTGNPQIHRDSILQFGHKGDAPLNRQGITFLVTGARLELRHYIDGVDAETLECDIQRHSTNGIYVSWPTQHGQEYNRWFSFTIKHPSFTVTGLLRHPSNQAPPEKEDYSTLADIIDGEVLTTSVATVMKTVTPKVRVGLGAQPRLHCQFGVDHNRPNVAVEWLYQHRRETAVLFNYSSVTGKSQGSGVRVSGIPAGDVSYTVPLTKTTNDGTYVCSVTVNLMLNTLQLNLHIEESPSVSLNVGPVLSLQEGAEQKVICEAKGYFPLDVHIVWHQQDPADLGKRVGMTPPTELQNTLLTSHKHHINKTYSLSSFFYLKASPSLSGKQYTCSVSHSSLRMPIKKNFRLVVEEPSSWLFVITIGVIILVLLLVIGMMLDNLYNARKLLLQKKPY